MGENDGKAREWREPARATADDLPQHVRTALEQIERLAIKAHCETGAGDLGPEAMYFLFQIFQAPDCSDKQTREAWLTTVDWLSRSLRLPALGGLRTALEELDRGLVSDGLDKRKGGGQGGKIPAGRMIWYQRAVEAANEIARRELSATRDHLISHKEEGAGVALSTMRDWQKIVGDAPTAFRPRLGWRIYYGEQSPVDVLRFAAEKIRGKKGLPFKH